MQKICLLFALVATLGSVFADEVQKEDGVLVLTDSNFDEELKKHEFLLVEFYAPWCGHCKKLAPEYSAAAEILAKNDPPFSLAKVDATEQKKLGERFEVKGFPTLFFFKNGEKTDYSGGRTTDTIVSWILKKSGPPSTQVTCAALNEKREANKFVIAFFGAESEALYTDAHVAYANAEDKIAFVHTDDAACATEHGASTPGIVFFRKFETTTVPYSGAADKESLVNFVKPLMVPTVFEFTEDEIEAVFGQQQPTAVLFRSKATDSDAAFMTTFADAAIAHKGKMLFAYSDVSGGIQERLAEFMGVTKDQIPTLRAILPADMKKFQSPNAPADLTVDNIGSFLDDVLAGNIKPHMKSEPVPENNDGGVTTIVGTQFDQIVNDPTKDVLVKYYAPWCGHCKKLAPIWEELGEAFKDNANIVIGKFDATANEAEGVEVKGYPTLIFYPRDNKKGVTFDGDRTLEPLKTYLQENSPVLKEGANATHDEL